MFDITAQWVHDVAVGGAILGGGGGGALDEGVDFGELAVEYDTPTIVPLSSLDDETIIVTVSAVGAPAATEQYVKPADYVRAFELVRDTLKRRGESVEAIMTNEMGGYATVNGLVQSAVTGIPIVDAACNGRAHPTGPMGSMGLPSTTQSLQSCVGGNPKADQYLELTIEAPLSIAADQVRTAADAAGGLIAVARNPVSAAYARKNAAVGVYEQTRAVGRSIRKADNGTDAMATIADQLNGKIVTTDPVDDVELVTRDGFDVGTVTIDNVVLTFWNEYMTIEIDGERYGTFPDLIATLDAETGQPISTATIEVGDEIGVLVAPAETLSLGAGMESPDLFTSVEETVDRPIIEYVFPDSEDRRNTEEEVSDKTDCNQSNT